VGYIQSSTCLRIVPLFADVMETHTDDVYSYKCDLSNFDELRKVAERVREEV
jgi:hypothetical protein